MPGGLTRVAPSEDVARISSQNRAINKDTWVLASEPERMTSFWLAKGPTIKGIDPMASMPSRAAESLWWLGRYATRAEAVTRLLREVHSRRNDFEGSPNAAGVAALRALLGALTEVTATYPGFSGPAAHELLDSPGRELLDLVIDDQRPGTLAHCVRALLDATYAVRDQLSNDTWLVVGSLDKEILALREPTYDPQAVVQAALARVMQSLLALNGLVAESMVRDIGWRFLDAGLRLERAIQLTSLLRASVTDARSTATDSLVLESVVTAAESIVTYRHRYRSRAQLPTMLDLLLLDPGNPRSLEFSLRRLADDLDALPSPSSEVGLREEQRLLLAASTTLRLADTEALAVADDAGHRPALDAFLGDLQAKLLATAEAIDRVHFAHLLPQRPLIESPADPRLGDGS
jgi:uncharacterized alpha-E superfamily protein